jgi:hypothetical protein
MAECAALFRPAAADCRSAQSEATFIAPRRAAAGRLLLATIFTASFAAAIGYSRCND